jgi:hypothetical protein
MLFYKSFLNTYLCFGFEGFLVRVGSLGGAVMFTRVLVSILENPKNKMILSNIVCNVPLDDLFNSE